MSTSISAIIAFTIIPTTIKAKAAMTAIIARTTIATFAINTLVTT